MKNFDLEAALAGEPVVTRDGQKVLWVKEVPDHGKGSLLVFVDGWFNTQRYYSDGTFYSPTRPVDKDLFMAMRQGFINIYPLSDVEAGPGAISYDYRGLQTGNSIFSNKKTADALARPSRVAVATFEYEE